MQRITLKLNEIQVEERQRQDLGDIDGLAESIRRFGLIQPIVVNQNKRLVAGGRRYAAHVKLGLATIDVVYKETLGPEVLHEMELEENIRRKNMSWIERCLGLKTIYDLRNKRGSLEGWSWGQKEAAESFGMSVGTFNYHIRVAQRLRYELSQPETSRPCHACTSVSDAWRNVIMREEEERAEAELARRQQEVTANAPHEKEAQKTIALVTAAEADPDVLAEERERYYSNPLNAAGSFDGYWAERVAARDELQNTIYLSSRFILGDSIAHMNANEDSYDHIVTDIPFAIDMDMLEQENQGMANIDLVREEHDVDENLKLIPAFFEAAFLCTRERAFVVTWCDQDNWQVMKDYALKAGFLVQRWPITWVKTHRCMNNAAQYNFTKSTEIAMVCRKPSATLVKPAGQCTISATNEEAKRITGHPFAKPFETTKFILDHISIEGQSVLDPFCGRGSMVLAMLQAKRNPVGVELNVAHYNALLENLKTYYRAVNPKFVFK